MKYISAEPLRFQLLRSTEPASVKIQANNISGVYADGVHLKLIRRIILS